MMMNTMMTKIKDLQNQWSSISPYTDGYLLVQHCSMPFHIGYQGEGHKCFVVLNTGKIDGIVSSKAISVDNIQLSDGSLALQFLLNYPSLDELFVKLCWDLIEASSNSESPIISLINQYNKWLKLLQKAGNGILSSSTQKGLIGELLYLKERLAKSSDEIKVLNCWVGPEGADQDFDFSDGWVEVKTTYISSSAVIISSLQQLYRNDDGLLCVYFMDRTSANTAKTLALNEMVSSIIEMLHSSNSVDLFLQKLARYGYQEKDASEYASYRFRLSEKRLYSVDASFPRLIPSSIPTEIVEAEYKISLPAINEYIITEA